MGERVTITRDDGELGTIDDSELDAALASGFRVVEESEATAIEKRRAAQSTGGMALGTGEALLRGVSMGVSDPILRALGADMEAAQARKENLGTFGAGAEVTGALAPALLTGGSSSAASLARLTPAGLAARAGATTERVVLAGTRSKVLAGAAQGGAEGFVAGVGQSASADALGDRDLAVERMLAGGVDGLGVGALLGGGMGGASRGLEYTAAGLAKAGRVAAERVGRLTTKADAAGDLTPSENVWEGLGRGLAKLQGRDPDTYGPLFGGVATRKGRDRILADMDEVRELTARGIKDGADAMNAASEDAIRLSGGVNKRARMRQLAPDARPRETTGQGRGRFARGPRSYALEHVDGVLARLDEDLADDLLSKETRADLLEVKRIYEVARRDADVVKTPDQAFMALDDAKRSADSVASRRRDQYENNRSPEAYKAWQRARALTDSTRSHLEDVAIYGDMAASQRRMNAAIAADMKALDDLPPQLQAFLAKGAVADSAVAMSLSRKSTRFGGESQHAAFQAAIDAKLNRLRVTRDETVLDADQLRRFDEAERSIKEMRAKLDEASEVADIHDRLSKARKDEGGGSPSLTLLSTFGPAAGAGFGFMLGGVPGAIAGSLAGTVLRPFTLVRGLAAAGNLLDRFGKYKAGIDSVASREASVATSLERLADGGRAAARTAARATRWATTTSARKESQESKGQRQARLLAVRTAVLAASSDPLTMATDMETAVAELHEFAPDVARGLVERSAVAVQFLASKAPSVYESEFGSSVKIVDPAALDRFERYVSAASDPLGAVEKIARGVFDKEAAETLQVVYPKMFVELQSRVLQMLGRRKQEGRPTSHEARVQLGLLLRMPLDDSLRPGFLSSLQPPEPRQTGVGPAPSSGARAKPIEVTGQRTDLGRLEAGELRG